MPTTNANNKQRPFRAISFGGGRTHEHDGQKFGKKTGEDQRPGLESRCFSVKHAGAPSIGLYFAEKIMSAFEQILSNKKYFHHLIICQILFWTKIRWKKFTCNSILIVDSEIQLLFLWDWTSSEHRDSTLGRLQCPFYPLGKSI